MFFKKIKIHGGMRYMRRKYTNKVCIMLILCVFSASIAVAKTIEEYAKDAVIRNGFTPVQIMCNDTQSFTIECKVQTESKNVIVVCQKTLAPGNDDYVCSMMNW
jgi:hypothetical protein